MPKIIDYPRASLSNSIDIANAIYDLGGHSTIHTCADKMNKKVSGAFKALVSGADKFGLIDNQRGDLSCTELFNQYRHSYSEEEEKKLLQKAFLSSNVFSDLYQRFRGRSVPANILDRILVREFSVAPPMASRVSGYFINGAKEVGLLDEDNKIFDRDIDQYQLPSKKVTDTEHEDFSVEPSNNFEADSKSHAGKLDVKSYTVHFNGPGLDTTIEISEEQDLHIIQAIIEMIKKKKNIADGGAL